jgi:hypothetical protein
MDAQGQPVKKSRKLAATQPTLLYTNAQTQPHASSAVNHLMHLRDSLLSQTPSPTFSTPRSQSPSSLTANSSLSSMSHLSPQEQAQEILRKRKEIKRVEELRKNADELRRKLKLLESVIPSLVPSVFFCSLSHGLMCVFHL